MGTNPGLMIVIVGGIAIVVGAIIGYLVAILENRLTTALAEGRGELEPEQPDAPPPPKLDEHDVLKVTIDPANLFHAGELPRMKEILDEAFALVGKDIVLAHAKDLDHDGEAGHKAAGQGVLDYDRYLGLLRKYDFKGPLLLHGLSAEQVPGCMAFLRAKLASSLKSAA